MGTVDDIMNKLHTKATRPSKVDERNAVCVADYVDDFAWLWDISDDNNTFGSWLETRNSQEVVLIIVWGGMPVCNSGSVANHITPFDWVLSASYMLLERDTQPKFSVIVVDVYSHRLQHGDAFTVDNLELLKAAMPWLRVVKEDYQAFLDEVGKNGSWKPTADLATEGKGHHRQVEGLKCAWQGMAVRAGDGHSISNILGPMLLAKDYGKSLDGVPTDREALLKLAERYGYTHSSGTLSTEGGPLDALSAPVSEAMSSLDLKDQEKLNVVLVDDMANHGWSDVVAVLIGAARNSMNIEQDSLCHVAEGSRVRLYATTSYAPLLSTLENVSNGDLKFKLAFSPARGPEVLLIDLRLFGWYANDGELATFGRALRLYQKLVSQGHGFEHLPSADIDRLRKQVEAWQSEPKYAWHTTDEYLELLTFVPRLIAELDCSLPIIIFSSTRQGRIIKAFSPYPCIITRFEKPYVFGYPGENLAEATASKFESALRDAVALLRGRSIMSRVDKLARRPENRVDARHIQIYIDESGGPGDPWFTVGGLMAVYKGNVGAGTLNRAIEEINGKNRPERPDWKDNGDVRGNGKEDAEFVEAVVKAAANSEVDLYVVAISSEKQTFEGISIEGVDLDNRYRHQVRILIETILYQILPFWVGVKPKIDIKLGTRVDSPPGGRMGLELRRRFGIGTAWVGKGRIVKPALVALERDLRGTDLGVHFKKVEEFARSKGLLGAEEIVQWLNFSDAFPLLLDVMRDYKDNGAMAPNVDICRAYVIRERLTGVDKVDQLHLLSDWVVHNIWTHRMHKKKLPKWVQECLVEPGFNAVDGPELTKTRTACRMALAGRSRDALKTLMGIVLNPSDPDVLRPMLLASVLTALGSIKANDFVEACRVVFGELSADRSGMAIMGSFGSTSNGYANPHGSAVEGHVKTSVPPKQVVIIRRTGSHEGNLQREGVDSAQVGLVRQARQAESAHASSEEDGKSIGAMGIPGVFSHFDRGKGKWVVRRTDNLVDPIHQEPEYFALYYEEEEEVSPGTKVRFFLCATPEGPMATEIRAESEEDSG